MLCSQCDKEASYLIQTKTMSNTVYYTAFCKDHAEIDVEKPKRKYVTLNDLRQVQG